MIMNLISASEARFLVQSNQIKEVVEIMSEVKLDHASLLAVTKQANATAASDISTLLASSNEVKTLLGTLAINAVDAKHLAEINHTKARLLAAENLVKELSAANEARMLKATNAAEAKLLAESNESKENEAITKAEDLADKNERIINAAAHEALILAAENDARSKFLAAENEAKEKSSLTEARVLAEENESNAKYLAGEYQFGLKQFAGRLLAAGDEQDQLRFMMGNVVHDIKTPLFSITADIKLLSETIRTHCSEMSEYLDSNGSIESLKRSLSQLDVHTSENLSSMDTTCRFLLMSIIRIMDYVKATSKIVLTPSPEQVSIKKVLAFAETCISNVSSGTTIVIHPVIELNDLIVTDSFYLTDNLLSLMSNATKYSDAGAIIDVTVQVGNKTIMCL